MITRNDCLILLNELNVKGIDTSKQLLEIVAQKNPSIEIIKFINDNRQLDLTNFYYKIRKSYNEKRSKLYINIVKEVEDPNEILTTLSAMLTQILIFARTVEDKTMFLRHARAEEISAVLNNYFKNYDITYAQKLLKVIKADIKCIEYITK